MHATNEDKEGDGDENKQISVQQNGQSLDQSQPFLKEFPAKGTLSVFNDSGNPLLTQVAIFARLLEQSQLDSSKQNPNGCDQNENLEDDHQPNNAGGNDEPVKRTTRGAQKRKEQESSQVLKDLNENVEAQANHYLVPPSTTKMLDSVISKDELAKIEAYTKARAKVLA